MIIEKLSNPKNPLRDGYKGNIGGCGEDGWEWGPLERPSGKRLGGNKEGVFGVAPKIPSTTLICKLYESLGLVASDLGKEAHKIEQTSV